MATRREELDRIFGNIDPIEKQLINPMLDELAFLEEQLVELRKFPFFAVNPNCIAMQKKTEAAKLYKELSANYANQVRILLNTLRKVESDEQNELLKRLEAFSQ